MSRVLRNILVMFQWVPLTSGGSVRHVCDMAADSSDAKTPLMLLTFPPGQWAKLDQTQRAAFTKLWQRDLRTFDDPAGLEWAALGPARRGAFNRLRKLRFKLPYPEPSVDLSPKPYVPPPGLFDSSTLAAEINRARAPQEREVLYQQLMAETASMMTARDGDRHLIEERLRQGVATDAEHKLVADLSAGRFKRPDHRPKTLHRRLAEDATALLLRTWDCLPQQKRWTQRKLLGKIKSTYGVSRSSALKILNAIREKAHRC